MMASINGADAMAQGRVGERLELPIRIALALVVVTTPAVSAKATELSPWRGVYECWGPLHADGTGRPERAVEFALVDDAVYADRDGARGRYKLTANGVLTMMSGPLSGTRYRQTGGLTFKLVGLTEDGPAICSFSPGKDVRAAGW
jgi:hypothetical protein